MDKNNGYSLLELLIITALASTLVAAVVINIGPALLSLSVEQVAAQVATNVSRIRREALKGKPNSKFELKNAVAGNHSGIFLSETPLTLGTGCQQASCGNGEQSICISSKAFCFKPGSTFIFEPSSGHLPNGQAIFISTTTRKLAVLVNRDGTSTIAELLSGEWKVRPELRPLSETEK